jgi:hypothetical protein
MLMTVEGFCTYTKKGFYQFDTEKHFNIQHTTTESSSDHENKRINDNDDDEVSTSAIKNKANYLDTI